MPPRNGKKGRRVSAAIFVVLGLVGAFLVSLVAGLRQDADVDPTVLAARDIGDPAEVRVEVLNGAGLAGIAGDATDRLRTVGFDVVFFGNAGRFDHERSVVLDRIGDPTLARAVAAALSIDSVATVPDSTLLLDVSVVLGGDWPPGQAAPENLVGEIRGLLERD